MNRVGSVFLPLLLMTAVIVFIVWPVAGVVWRGINPDGVFQPDYILRVISEYRQCFVNTLLVAVLSSALAVFTGLGIALFEKFSGGWPSAIVKPCLLLAMIAPPFVSSLAWLTLFGRNGMITAGLLGLNINPYGWHGIVAMQGLAEIPLAALVIGAALSGVNTDVLRAARDLGAGPVRTLVDVVIPLLRPALGASFFLCFTRSLADFGTPLVIGGGFDVLASAAYMAIIAHGNLPEAAALSILILLPALVLLPALGRIRNAPALGQSAPDIGWFRLPCWFVALLASLTGIFFVACILQMAAIVAAAVTRYANGGYVLTMEYFSYWNQNNLDCLWRSMLYAGIAGVIGSFAGVVLEYCAGRRKFRGARLLKAVAAVPYIIPGTLFGIGYVIAFNSGPLELTGTAAIVVINCVFRTLMVGIQAGAGVLAGISADVEHAARDLGASGIRVLADIVFPLLRPAILTAFANVFTSTMMTVGAVIFIISPAAKIATVDLFELLSSGRYGEAAALAVMMTGVTLAVNILAFRFAGGLEDRSNVIVS